MLVKRPCWTAQDAPNPQPYAASRARFYRARGRGIGGSMHTTQTHPWRPSQHRLLHQCTVQGAWTIRGTKSHPATHAAASAPHPATYSPPSNHKGGFSTDG
eukprot:1142822-Karenia_brevis.AAC.1